MNLDLINEIFIKDWMKDFHKLKNVKSALHITKAGSPKHYVLRVCPKDDTNLSVIDYKLNNKPSIDSDEDYQYIYSDLKTKGYG